KDGRWLLSGIPVIMEHRRVLPLCVPAAAVGLSRADGNLRGADVHPHPVPLRDPRRAAGEVDERGFCRLVRVSRARAVRARGVPEDDRDRLARLSGDVSCAFSVRHLYEETMKITISAVAVALALA